MKKYLLAAAAVIPIIFAIPASAEVRDLFKPIMQGNRVGPSFDCYSSLVANEPLPQAICSNDELSRLDVAYVNVYQAVRHGASEQERRLMVSEANAFVDMVYADCRLPRTGTLNEPSSTQVDCIRNRYENQRSIMLHRLSGPALEEAQVTPPDAVTIQEALKERGMLSESATVDGVLGPQTRAAISDFQRLSGLTATGFASRETVTKLLHPEAPALTPVVQPTPTSVAPAPTPAPAPLTPITNQSTAEFKSTDIPRIVENSQNNEIRFNRDYKGRTFDSNMAFKSASEDPFMARKYRISFTAVGGEGQVDCYVTDKQTIDMIADWSKGRSARVSGEIRSTVMGDVQLDSCTIQ